MRTVRFHAAPLRQGVATPEEIETGRADAPRFLRDTLLDPTRPELGDPPCSLALSWSSGLIEWSVKVICGRSSGTRETWVRIPARTSIHLQRNSSFHALSYSYFRRQYSGRSGCAKCGGI